jgi:hypothetical protein
MSQVWISFLLGIGAGIGVMLVIINLRGVWQFRRERASGSIGSEAQRWLERHQHRQDP